MNLNKLVFPAPLSSYDTETLEGQLVWIPRRESQTNKRTNKKSRSKSYEKISQEKKEQARCPNAKKFTRRIATGDEFGSFKPEGRSVRIGSYSKLEDNINRSKLDDIILEDLPTTTDSSNTRRTSLHLDSPTTFRPPCRAYRVIPHSKSKSALDSYTLANLEEKKKSGMYLHKLEKAKNCDTRPRAKNNGGCFAFFTGGRKRVKSDDEEKAEEHVGRVVRNMTRKQTKSMSKSMVNSDSFDCSESVSPTKPCKSSKKDGYVTMNKKAATKSYIPSLIIQHNCPNAQILIYFHANHEDIYQSYDLLAHLQRTLKVHVIAGEYPGYGIYRGAASESKIISDADAIYDYVLNTLKVKEQDIILLGRSIGSGPAIYLASKRQPGALILMSSFTSIRAIAKYKFGVVGQYLIKERFNNVERIMSVNAPTLVIHGRKDDVVPHKQAELLFDACTTKKRIEIREDMSHNQFDFHDDLSTPISDFLSEVSKGSPVSQTPEPIEFAEHLFRTPPTIPQ